MCCVHGLHQPVALSTMLHTFGTPGKHCMRVVSTQGTEQSSHAMQDEEGHCDGGCKCGVCFQPGTCTSSSIHHDICLSDPDAPLVCGSAHASLPQELKVPDTSVMALQDAYDYLSIVTKSGSDYR